jgi:hypothetical protein
MQTASPINPVFQKYNWKAIHQNIVALSSDFSKGQGSGAPSKDRSVMTDASRKIEELVRHAALLS